MNGNGKINILIALSDIQLKKKLSQILADDWAYHWHIIDQAVNDMAPDETDIALLDSDHSTNTLAPKAVKLLLSRHAKRENGNFATISSLDPIDIYTEIKRAYSHRQILVQNREALVPQLENSENLASLAQSLSAKVTQLVRQSEMRIALVDQMPVGVIGVDDENVIVLANPKAIEILGYDDIPIWGMPVANVLSPKVNSFLPNTTCDITTISRNNENIVIRKSEFKLQGTVAGTILILTKDFPDQEDNNLG